MEFDEFGMPILDRGQEDKFLLFISDARKIELTGRDVEGWAVSAYGAEAAWLLAAREVFRAHEPKRRAAGRAALLASGRLPSQATPAANPASGYLVLCARKHLERELAACGSPAEEAMLAGFELVEIYPVQQHQIGAHRADFAFPDRRLVIEVDGHTWHEKTEEQAQRDKARDRDLVAAGWTVVRFTAREVFTDAVRCARQVAEILGGRAA